jgi:putative ABC transport system permease protein
VSFPGFAELLGVPLRAGRYFTREDATRPIAPVMVDEQLAAQLFGQNAVGKRLLLSQGSRPPAWTEVVGVVAHMQTDDLRHAGRPQLWVPFRLMPWALDVAVRTHRDPRIVAAAVKNAIEHVGPGRPLYALRTLDEYVTAASADARFALFVLAMFAVVALVLTIVGVYAMVAYATARRAREIALRLALGADARRIVGLIVRENATWTAVGLVAGVIGARVVTRYIQTLLYGVAETDVMTYAGISALLCTVAITATAVPAIKTVRRDPMRALRTE